MTPDILTAAGVKHKRNRFPSPPAETYAVWFDDIDTDGPDPIAPPIPAGLPYIELHSVTIELYEPRPDDATEAAIEAELRARGIHYEKTDRVWLQDVQRYMVVYTFEYYSKS